MRRFLCLCCVLLIAACAAAPRSQNGDILVIGDSVLAWNRAAGADVGRVIRAELGRDVLSQATLGAQIRPGGLARLGGLSIPAQLPAGRWNWVVMNGGANDLGFSCGCTRCEDDIDLLISPDARTGAIPDLILTARRQGAQVLWAGYYAAPESRSFKGCRPGLVELERRIAAFARTQEGVFFLDTEEVFDPNRQDLFANDRTHPSAAGSAVIGRFLAQEIARRSTR